MATIRKGKPETRSAATAPPPPARSAGELPSERIAARAYEIWQASGRPEGHDQEHWFQAERELRSSRAGRPN